MKCITLIIFSIFISFTSFATIDSIRGHSTVCIGSIDTLRDSTSSGIWSSSNMAVGTIDSIAGIFTGISAGTTTITFTVDANYVTKMVTVNSIPVADTILCDCSFCHYLCPWGCQFYDSTPGGIWGLTNNTIARIDSVGFAIPIYHGLTIFDTITYIVSNSCGSDTAKFSVGLGLPCEGKVNTVVNTQIPLVYPNPATKELTISTSDKISSIVISNLLGQVLFSQQFNSQQVQIDVSDLPAGMYLIKINGTEVRKFVKE